MGNMINFWLNPIATDFPILEKAFSACLNVGNHVFANYTSSQIVWQAVERGDTLGDVSQFLPEIRRFRPGQPERCRIPDDLSWNSSL